MRISLILLFAVVLQLPASNGYAQRTRGSFSMSSVSIENVLNKIEENSDYVFLYNNKTIQADRIVSVNSRSGKITEILDDMFRGTNVTYTLVDNQIILSTKQIKQQEPKIKVDGVVKDATGEPLIGVNVKVKNTIAGTITDLDGKFNLDGRPDAEADSRHALRPPDQRGGAGAGLLRDHHQPRVRILLRRPKRCKK